MNYSLANDYFDKKKTFGLVSWIMLGLAVVALVLAIFVAWWIAFACVLLAVLAFVLRQYAVTDQQYDNLISAIETDVESQALTKLGISKDVVASLDPIYNIGYQYEECRSRVGKDGKVRTNKYLMTYVMFGSEQVHYYSCVEVTTSNNSSYDTHVCFYKDIVSVITESHVTTIGVKGTVTLFTLQLVTSGSSTIEIQLDNGYRHQDTINALRKVIKSRKS